MQEKAIIVSTQIRRRMKHASESERTSLNWSPASGFLSGWSLRASCFRCNGAVPFVSEPGSFACGASANFPPLRRSARVCNGDEQFSRRAGFYRGVEERRERQAACELTQPLLPRQRHSESLLPDALLCAACSSLQLDMQDDWRLERFAARKAVLRAGTSGGKREDFGDGPCDTRP